MSDRVLATLLSFLQRYRMEKKRIHITRESLGHGGYGDVVLGLLLPPDRRAGTKVAVKQLRSAGTKAESERTSILFARELKVWAGVEQPHVVPLVGFYLSDSKDAAWLVSPYMKHGNIREYLLCHMPARPARIRLLHETMDGISYLHSMKICHGDIKSGNILIDDLYHARICDFGLAKILESGPSGLTTSKGLGGSIRYMAPELLNDDQPARTMESDIWALACTALEIILDQLPYSDVNRESLLVIRIARCDLPATIDTLDLPIALKALLVRCWSADPCDRLEISVCLKDMEEIEKDEGLSSAMDTSRAEPLQHSGHHSESQVELHDMNPIQSSGPSLIIPIEYILPNPRAADPEVVATRALWIGSIPETTTTEILLSVFGAFGPIESTRVLGDKNCGFVNFERVADAINARKVINGYTAEAMGSNAEPMRIRHTRVLGQTTGRSEPAQLVRTTSHSSRLAMFDEAFQQLLYDGNPNHSSNLVRTEDERSISRLFY